MVVGISGRSKIMFFAYKPLVWRGLLYHTGRDLRGQSYPRQAIKVTGVFIGIEALHEAVSIDDLSSTTIVGIRRGAWFQDKQYLYVRLRHDAEEGPSCSAQDWMFSDKTMMIESYYTSDKFEVKNENAVRHAVLSKYNIKNGAELNDFSILKFSSAKIDLLRKYVIFNIRELLGKFVNIYNNDITRLYEKQYIDNVTFDNNVISISCKDIRSSYAGNVIDQKFNRDDYKNTSGNVVIDKDTVKKYKADAIGYCVSVTGECINGYAYDIQPYRKYRFGYGKITVDYDFDQYKKGVEVEIENGWRVMEKGVQGQENSWWTEEIAEKLPSGATIMTTLICIPSLVAHPPEEGVPTPDYDRTPRKLRATGYFHAEIPNSTRVSVILKYLLDRYSSQIYNTTNFNIDEISSELEVVDNAPIGIYFDKPVKLYNAIGLLQAGTKFGWQFYQNAGKITVRVFSLDRTPWGKIKQTDIINLDGLKPSADGSNYASETIIGYAKNYGEDAYSEYSDYSIRDSIIKTRNIPKSRKVETLLKDEADAKARFEQEVVFSKEISHVITGVNLRAPIAELQRFHALRIYDIVEIDFGELIESKTGYWIVTNVEINIDTNMVTIAVKEKV